jgi:hypothetical protein
LSNLVGLINNSSTEGDSTQGVDESELQTAIDEAGGTIIFYKLADGEDNDGDGCVDEEIYDQKDNDGDGIIDEDLRRGQVLVPETLADSLDNDKDGDVDEIDELFEEENIDFSGGRSVVFSTVESYFKGPKYTDKDYRLEVALDTNFALISLEERRLQIGGCW